MELFKQFTFDSAHFLPHVPAGHKCRGMHGHTYRLTVYVSGPVQEPYGWVMDFTELKAVVAPVIARLDHRVLNEIPGLENPTCEFVAKWLWDTMIAELPGLSRIELMETATSGVVYTGR
jgi:6-pyruvoyltetrahydropterin/6-carboxytetrahydropterin synthase